MTVEVKLKRNAEILFEEYGQRRSMNEMRPVDRNGAPIPWYTYPCIEYLQSFSMQDALVFEYGCGHSSLFWAYRTKHVFCVEHEPLWFEALNKKGAPNLTASLIQDQPKYIGAISAYDFKFDVVVIDGRWRLNCIPKAAECLAPGGIILLDNSDWYPKACAQLRNIGFFQCDFSGFGPINNYTWTTSLFIMANTRLQHGFCNPSPLCSIKQQSDHND